MPPLLLRQDCPNQLCAAPRRTTAMSHAAWTPEIRSSPALARYFQEERRVRTRSAQRYARSAAHDLGTPHRCGSAIDRAVRTRESQTREGAASVSPASTAPKLFRGPSALGHRCQLGPHHVGIDRGLADPGAETAIAADDDVVAADEVGVAGDALCDQLRMLDEVRFRLDDPGNDCLP